MEGERILRSFGFSFVELAVWGTEKAGRHDAQELIDVMFDVFFDLKKLRRHVKKS